jgi:hypothetical protein
MDPGEDSWDPFNVTVGNFTGMDEVPMEEIRILVPEGFRDVISVDTTT